MKLTAQHVYDATIVLAAIINQNRELPLKGKYLVARMHAKLLVEFKVIDARRDEMIKAYDNPSESGFQVPEDKMDEFTTAWKTIGDEEIDVDVQPIALAALALPDGSSPIRAIELVTLGVLVTE